jgi:hypothetical protein
MKNWIWLFLSLLATAVTSAYTVRVLKPYDRQWGEVRDGIRNPMGDLYSPWVGARELLLHRRNPYGPEVSHQIQMAFYGHTINQNYQGPPESIVNEQRFAYPVYVVFVLAPAVYSDFAQVRRVAWIVLALLTALTVWLCLDLLRRSIPWEIASALVLFTLSSPQIVQGLRLEQLGLYVGFLLIAGAWCVNRHHFKTAGLLLALSTIKPQMSLMPLCWFAIWTLGDWRNRRNLALGFAIASSILFLLGELFLPGWFGYFITGLSAYRMYSPNSSLLCVALGDTLGNVVGATIVLGLVVFAWRNRVCAADSKQFSSLLAAFLMGALLVFSLFPPFNQVLLIFPAMLLLQDWHRLPRFPQFVFGASVSWPWVTSLLLLFLPPLRFSNQLPLLPNFLELFFPILLPLILMSRRRGRFSRPSSSDLPSSWR